MFHREIGEAISHFLATSLGEKPVKLMDLGCGDASQTLAAFSRCKLDFYHGCDVSEVALGLADQNLVRTDIKYVLEKNDILASVSNADHQFDVIFSSFAMHHLGLAQKRDFLRNVRARLNTDGMLILVDLARDENEDRAAYLEHYLGYALAHWSDLTLAEHTAISHHAALHDYPERTSTYRELSNEAGFAEPLTLCRHTWHHVWVIRNQATGN
jgi:cyclopropane fatty-acyl-phospholipid synthase-like methyltransferase